MNWFLCVLGFLCVAAVAFLCLHYMPDIDEEEEETFVDHASDANEDEMDLVASLQNWIGTPSASKENKLTTTSEEDTRAAGMTATEEESTATEEESMATEEEAIPVSTKKDMSTAEEETGGTPAAPLTVVRVIDDVPASTATPAEEEIVAAEEARKVVEAETATNMLPVQVEAETATNMQPVQAVLQVIDVPPPEEEDMTRIIPEEETTSAPIEETVSYQDDTYAYHPSPKDEVVEVDEPGYVYLPSRFWSVPQKRPPPCTPATKPKVCPIFTNGVPEGALEWRSTVRERQLRAAVRPAHARHRRDPKLDYYYPGYYAKGDVYKHKCA